VKESTWQPLLQKKKKEYNAGPLVVDGPGHLLSDSKMRRVARLMAGLVAAVFVQF